MRHIIDVFKRSENVGLVVVLIVVIVVFSVLQSSFFTVPNFINILFAASVVGMVMLGEAMLIIGGQIDLSPGSVAAFSGVLAAILFERYDLSVLPVVAIVIAAAVLIGLINSQLVNFLKIQPFIATLATMSIFRGLAHIICGGSSVHIRDRLFIYFGAGRIFGIPISIIFLIVVSVIFFIILNRTRFGRHVYMIGGNETAARLAGLNPERIKVALYIITSVLASIGGMLLAGRMNSGQPVAHNGLEFDAITVVILGGVSFSGGSGTLTGCFIALLILESFKNGLLVLNVPVFWQQVARGLLLVIALSIDYFRSIRRKKASKDQ
ncbi:MAG: ABC transporter permease [Dethiobacteria bacterium]|jgi:ribose transport system permease protein|nr:ABC transporter permease [Bacillota bacterium]HOJ83313.1 ABC transporter permease [Bacillota bacterium]HOL16796.1 ABC transporter permease [Bacillota bacterium]HQE10574.1 ABC transporter permease [Bacillota bacterium]